MSSPQMTRMFGFLPGACASTIDAMPSIRPIAAPIPKSHRGMFIPSPVATRRGAAAGMFPLLERKDTFPVVLHADDGPALLLCFVVEGLCESADLGVAQALRRAVGVFAPLIVV